MDPIADASRPENPLQRAVRLLGVLSFFGILGAGPVCQLLAGPASSHASLPFPEWSWSRVRSGDWMSQVERHAQEFSPVTYTLRGHYNETLFRLGLLDPSNVLLGSDSWMFMASTLNVDQARLDGGAEARSRTLESLKRRCDELGVKLLALPVPDKVRMYPERAFGDGRLPPEKESLYPLILREFAAAGIPVLNVEEVLREEKQSAPDVLLFHERDSHWTGHATRVVAAALRAHLEELGWDEQFGEPVELLAGGVSVEVVPDLVGTLGFRAIAGPFVGHARSLPATPGEDAGYQRISSLARSLSEEKDYYRVWIKGAGGEPVEIDEEHQRGSKVALCGTSFSQECFHWSLAFDLGRVVDSRGVVAAGGAFTGLEAQLERIERGESQAEILLWEMVERSYLEIEWLNPPVF